MENDPKQKKTNLLDSLDRLRIEINGTAELVDVSNRLANRFANPFPSICEGDKSCTGETVENPEISLVELFNEAIEIIHTKHNQIHDNLMKIKDYVE